MVWNLLPVSVLCSSFWVCVTTLILSIQRCTRSYDRNNPTSNSESLEFFGLRHVSGKCSGGPGQRNWKCSGMLIPKTQLCSEIFWKNCFTSSSLIFFSWARLKLLLFFKNQIVQNCACQFFLIISESVMHCLYNI